MKLNQFRKVTNPFEYYDEWNGTCCSLLVEMGISAGLGSMEIMTCIFCLLLTGLIQNIEQQARIERLENLILAPCCYREPVSRHGSEIAQTIRLEKESETMHSR